MSDSFKKFKKIFIFDWKIFLAVIVLMVSGGVAVYSSTYSPDATRLSWIFLKYIFFSLTGFVIICIVMFTNYTKLAEHRMALYIPMLISYIMLLIPIFGKNINGSSRWLFGVVQPSEFGKIIMIIVLAGYLDSIGDKIKDIKYFLLTGLLLGIPIVLILLQPDLGTVLVYCFISFVMLFVAGVPTRFIIACLVTGIIGLSIPMFLEYERLNNFVNNPLFIFFSRRTYIVYMAAGFLFVSILLITLNFYMNNKLVGLLSFSFFVLFMGMIAALAFDMGLRDYQKQRLLVFMNPELKRLSSGYNVIQSLIAVGNGGFLGEGFLQGSQSQLNFIPQQVNDFIFSNITEEWGFLGSTFILFAYAVIFVQGLSVAYYAKDRLGVLLVSGIIAMFLFHVVINVGMVLGMMPITGLTLPFISSGGSSIWTFCVSIGLIFNVGARRYVHNL